MTIEVKEVPPTEFELYLDSLQKRVKALGEFKFSELTPEDKDTLLEYLVARAGLMSVSNGNS